MRIGVLLATKIVQVLKLVVKDTSNIVIILLLRKGLFVNTNEFKKEI